MWEKCKVLYRRARMRFAYRALESSSVIAQDEKGIGGWKELADGPWLGLALGLVAGAAASVAPAATLPWIFLLAWSAASFHFLRHLLRGRGIVRAIANCIVIPLVGAGLWLLKDRLLASIPPPQKDAATPTQITDEFCRRSPWLCAPPPTQKPSATIEACHLKFDIATEAVARLYGRHEIPTTPKANLSIDFQELFYEWKASFVAFRTISHLTVKINHLTDADVVTVVPASQASVSELSPEWFSGFREPARTKADYYSRIVTFEALANGDKAAISLRRALDVANISPVNVVRIDDARTKNCSAPTRVFDENETAKKIETQLQALANFKWGQIGGPPRPLPLRHDPGDVQENEIETTVEARCKIPSCEQVIVGRLEVHTGSVPPNPVTITVDKKH